MLFFAVMRRDEKPKPETAAHQRQVHGLDLPRPTHPELRRLKRLHRPTAQGIKVWNATWILLDFLSRQDLPPGLRVLDVGCGWGLASIWLARHREARVTAADKDPAVFPFAHFHAQLNQAHLTPLQADLATIPAPILQQTDLLIGADICFHPDLIPPLHTLIQRALDQGIPRIALADPGRAPFRNLCTRLRPLPLTEHPWHTQEPLLSWPGNSPRLSGHLLTRGLTQSLPH